MAFIQCPECEQSISDKATKCPKCGYPIKEYLDSKAEETPPENSGDDSAGTEDFANIQKPPKQKSKKKIALIAALVVIAAALVAAVSLGIFKAKLSVEDITIGKWRLTDSSGYSDCYEGIITSAQKKPFVAVIGQYDDIVQYDDEESVPEFAYVENGNGVFKTWVDSDEDPSIKYRPIGYLGGTPVDISDMKVKYSDSGYYDPQDENYSYCIVTFNIEMNKDKDGLLIFDIVNETYNETYKNMVAVVVNGKAEYKYGAKLPHKARGIDVSIEPKMFCESAAIKTEDYMIEEKYTATRHEGYYSDSYSGRETLTFPNCTDGFVIYTQELKDGGNKDNRNVVQNLKIFLRDGECTLTTYDSADKDETILMPRYEFNIIGYVTWTTLEKEIA